MTSDWQAKVREETRDWPGHQVYVLCNASAKYGNGWEWFQEWRLAYLIGVRGGMGVVRFGGKKRTIATVHQENLWSAGVANPLAGLREVTS